MPDKLPAETSMGAVRLAVANFDRMREFYEHSVGLQLLGRTATTVVLGVPDQPIVELVHIPGARPRPRPSTGLFHLAVLVPSRLELARAIQRVVDSGWSFTGASDHLVSEAMYLDDPEGNGIEIYRDRPRSDWESNGELKMATLPLDIDGIMEEITDDRTEAPEMADGTRIGHVHMQVADLANTESFYCDALGFEVMARAVPGALFVSAGGYHHHIGLNVWGSAGAPPAGPGTRGLDSFEISLPDNEDLNRVEQRLKDAGWPVERNGPRLRASDPSDNHLVLTATA